MVKPSLSARKANSFRALFRQPTHGSGLFHTFAIHDNLIGWQDDHFLENICGSLACRIKVTHGFNAIPPKLKTNRLRIKWWKNIHHTTPNGVVSPLLHERCSLIPDCPKSLKQIFPYDLFPLLQVVDGFDKRPFGQDL